MDNHTITEDFKLDSETSTESESDNDATITPNYDHLKVELFVAEMDKHDVKYFPKPYNEIAQFILSSIAGAATSYVMKLRQNLPTTDQTMYEMLDVYYDYCMNANDDEYLNELMDVLKFNLTVDIRNNYEMANLLSKCKTCGNKILSKLQTDNNFIFEQNMKLSDNDFNVENFNCELLIILTKLIKYSDVVNIV